jgi:Mg2+-importing ATPase
LVLESKDLHTNESALTGESFPVEKEPGISAADAPLSARLNALFEGSSVMSGTGRVLVVKTGDATEFGKITAQMAAVTPETSA